MIDLIYDELAKNLKSAFKSVDHLANEQAINSAWDFFNGHRLPEKSDENWQNSSFSKDLHFQFPKKAELNLDALKNFDSIIGQFAIDRNSLMVFVDGQFIQQLSTLPKSMTLNTLETKKNHEFYNIFDSINFLAHSALSNLQYLEVVIPENSKFETPITLLQLTQESTVNKMLCPRIIIDAKKESKAAICEIFVNQANTPITINHYLNFKVGEMAQIEHVQIFKEQTETTFIGLTKADVETYGELQTVTLNLGRKLSRHDFAINLNGKEARAQSLGLYDLKKDEQADFFVKICHQASYTYSEQFFKGVLNDESTGIFQGEIDILEGAQKIEAHQLNKNLILSKKARAFSKPKLLVAADDVKCSHGATIGQLSFDEEFYLLARGIRPAKAKKLLIDGFISEIILKIKNEKLKEFSKANTDILGGQ